MWTILWLKLNYETDCGGLREELRVSAGILPVTSWRGCRASVPILKFLCTFCLGVECAATEALDGCQDVIGGFCPAERLGRGISDFDIGGDRGLEFELFGQEREKALDLIDPG
jgi:hypothetical protein